MTTRELVEYQNVDVARFAISKQLDIPFEEMKTLANQHLHALYNNELYDFLVTENLFGPIFRKFFTHCQVEINHVNMLDLKTYFSDAPGVIWQPFSLFPALQLLREFLKTMNKVVMDDMGFFVWNDYLTEDEYFDSGQNVNNHLFLKDAKSSYLQSYGGSIFVALDKMSEFFRCAAQCGPGETADIWFAVMNVFYKIKTLVDQPL